MTMSDGDVLGTAAGPGQPGISWQAKGDHPSLFAIVEEAMEIGEEGADVVVDFDVGRSFLWDGGDAFTFIPHLRAIIVIDPRGLRRYERDVLHDFADVEAITQVLAPFDQFDVRFERVDRFPGTLWLAPEPAEPFVAMTEAMNNSVRHAHATHRTVRLRPLGPDGVRIVVGDALALIDQPSQWDLVFADAQGGKWEGLADTVRWYAEHRSWWEPLKNA